MKDQDQKQYAGVWMDHHQAMFITEAEGAFTIQQDKIVAGEYHGDKGEHAANNAEKTDNRKYFKTIGNHLLKYDEIFIFGPGKSQEELLNFLHEDNHFKSKKITLGSAEKMTDPQTVAKVREFFKS
jgi:stalled ribosome rescue protein Dom34